MISQGARPRLCGDIRDPAVKFGWNHTAVADPVYPEITTLVDDDAYSTQDLASHIEEYRKPQTLVVIPKCRVRDDIGLVLLPDGTACVEGHWWASYLVQNPAYSARFRRRRQLEGDWFSLLGTWSNTYYHWFHDTLPKLIVCLKHIPEETQFLVSEDLKQYQIESLELLGLSQDRLKQQPTKIDTIPERMWFSTTAGYTTFGSGFALREVSKRIVNAIQKRVSRSKFAGGSSRIYISRDLASARKVSNEASLISVLEEYSFVKVRMEELTFEEQILTMMHANVVVGPHGAGLVNLIFMPTGGTVGEVASEDVVPCYSVLSKQCGHRFRRFTATQSGGREGFFNVDSAEFAQWLAEICDYRPNN